MRQLTLVALTSNKLGIHLGIIGVGEDAIFVSPNGGYNVAHVMATSFAEKLGIQLLSIDVRDDHLFTDEGHLHSDWEPIFFQEVDPRHLLSEWQANQILSLLSFYKREGYDSFLEFSICYDLNSYMSSVDLRDEMKSSPSIKGFALLDDALIAQFLIERGFEGSQGNIDLMTTEIESLVYEIEESILEEAFVVAKHHMKKPSKKPMLLLEAAA